MGSGPPRPTPELPPASPTRTPALPPVERSRSVGSGSGGAGGSGGGAGAGGSGGASTSSGAGLPPKGAAPAPSAALRPQVTLPPPAPLYYDPNKCAGCGKAFGLLGGAFTVAAGRKWHPACFKCGFCGEAMLPGTAFSMNPGDPRPFHPDCYKHVHIPTCHVCGTYIPIEPDGRVSWKENGFWKERFCNSHDESRLVRCCGCTRIQKHGEEWPPLPDGRHLCLHCLGSVVLDTREAQPLYEDVLAFYRDEMRLPLQYKPPVLLVDGPTLNEHARKEGRDGTDAAAPVFHVRGLCVWNAYSHMPSMMRDRSGMVRSVSTALRSAGAAAMAGIVHCSVQVVLVLYGLPRLLCGSILAHELMHAWLRMAGVVSLPLKVEEGLCQLMACLWLDRQHELLHGKPEEQRLASFFSYQIRTEPSEVYGDGFREALEAFQSHGLTAMLNNIKRYGRFLP
ncbi:hypothetical protein HYH03_004119 [Edaphochlamys debaryana]|uniref:LIM zinc-binding domain-containing protein n=1 Tax=Edaphochlamys debaryana TaxID=47281 RepID=A0A835Y7T0_9CHLO|nr:hypothetical protein HYH03_004119 [Edaphochlamys debaryana]|eukprot:KAG2497852.1 hypothetical protein HYH03_004119 [Edaphochlamys debaryana]